jgi:hypothetical protein
MPNLKRLPWNFNPELGRKKARLYRLVRSGKAPAGDKASLRQAAIGAVREYQAKASRPRDEG